MYVTKHNTVLLGLILIIFKTINKLTFKAFFHINIFKSNHVIINKTLQRFHRILHTPDLLQI